MQPYICLPGVVLWYQSGQQGPERGVSRIAINKKKNNKMDKDLVQFVSDRMCRLFQQICNQDSIEYTVSQLIFKNRL